MDTEMNAYMVVEVNAFDELAVRVAQHPTYLPFGGVVVGANSFAQVLLLSDSPKTETILFAALLALGRACPKA
jgi:hypothetical protein